MSDSCPSTLDPRIRRTRHLLYQALNDLMETREFEKISVQDIAEAATVNRATFYDHYPDKFALLQSMVGARFQEMLAARGVRFDGSCSGALKAIVLCVCDYVGATPCQIQPHMESAVIGVVRGMILEGLSRHPPASGIPPELMATTISWAIYGATKEWLQTAGRCSADEISDTIVHLVSPVFAS
jgi:AcrR family transcriptional regulator